MIQPKPKRGHPFIVKATKEIVYLNRVKENGLYFCSLDERQNVLSEYNDFRPEDLTNLKQISAPIRQVVKPVSEEEKKFRTDLTVFFASQILTMPERCENCNELLGAYNATTRKACIAHILPKGKNNGNFKSVACHPLNRMFLGPFCGCHHKWDHAKAEERAKMPCYKIAIERFDQFKDTMPGPEKIRAFTYLAIQWQ